MPTDVQSTIPIHSHGNTIEVVVISGFAQITTFGIEYQRTADETRSIVDLHDGKIGRLYPVGSPGEIADNGGLVCFGRLFKTAGDNYNVVCSFKQDGGHL